MPAFPIATPADKLPKMKLPPGFKVEVYAANVLDARGLRQGDKGGKREVKTLLEKLELANGSEFHKGSLYVATPKAITRYDAIENKLDGPGDPAKVYDQLPGDVPHGWKLGQARHLLAARVIGVVAGRAGPLLRERRPTALVLAHRPEQGHSHRLRRRHGLPSWSA